MNTAEQRNSYYKIGAAARLASISPNTIRTWIRRDYFKPSRVTETGNRLIASKDVRRLILIRGLIEKGDSISRIHQLSDSQLDERLSNAQKMMDGNNASIAKSSIASLKALFVGPEAETRFNSMHSLFSETRNVKSIEALAHEIDSGNNAKVALIDFRLADATHSDDIIGQSKARPDIYFIIVFDFLPRAYLNKFTQEGIHLVRWPINAAHFERELYRILSFSTLSNNPSTEKPFTPEKLFTERELARIAEARTNLGCECPRHISSIVSNLLAFEEFSFNCESEHPEDQSMHRYLGEEAARARQIMEVALARLCAHDSIPMSSV